MPTLEQQLRSAERELRMRLANYPKWVNAGKMTRQTADHEIECQKAIIETVRRRLWFAEISEEMKREIEAMKNERTA